MKNIFLALSIVASASIHAQIKSPQLSPAAKTEQTVGLTTITIDYSRPSARGRNVFGDLVQYDELWRTGANKNSTIKTSDVLIFGKDTLKAGTYSIFTTPGKSNWKLYFYKTTDNWGTPESWDVKQIALETSAKSSTVSKTETFTISLDDVSINGASLAITWGEVSVKFPFTVSTDATVEASIAQTLSGPSANDYYRAADYYHTAGKDMKKALEWINIYLEKTPDPQFWVLRKKSLIQAELKDYKGAVATAKVSLEKAKAAKNADYVRMNEASIAEWSAK